MILRSILILRATSIFQYVDEFAKNRRISTQRVSPREGYTDREQDFRWYRLMPSLDRSRLRRGRLLRQDRHHGTPWLLFRRSSACPRGGRTFVHLWSHQRNNSTAISLALYRVSVTNGPFPADRRTLGSPVSRLWQMHPYTTSKRCRGCTRVPAGLCTRSLDDLNK